MQALGGGRWSPDAGPWMPPSAPPSPGETPAVSTAMRRRGACRL